MTEQVATAPQPAQNRVRKSALDMVRTMAVVVAVVVGLLLLVPRTTGITQPPVNPAEAAVGVRADLGYPPVVPVGLPAGWNARTAGSYIGAQGVMTWHLTYLTPSGHYAGVQQAAHPTHSWESVQVTSGPDQGMIKVAGREWLVRSRLDRGVTSWVLRTRHGIVVVTGTASPAELRVLADSLRPLPADR